MIDRYISLGKAWLISKVIPAQNITVTSNTWDRLLSGVVTILFLQLRRRIYRWDSKLFF